MNNLKPDIKHTTIQDVPDDRIREMGADHLSADQALPLEQVEDGVPDEIEVVDNDFVRMTHLFKDGHLIFHFWRGAKIPNGYWGKGHFGLAIQAAIRSVFPADTPDYDYRDEVKAYFAIIPNVDKKPSPVKPARIDQVGHQLVAILNNEIE